MSQFELFASLECADLSALWPKRCQGTALQEGEQFKLRIESCSCDTTAPNPSGPAGLYRKIPRTLTCMPEVSALERQHLETNFLTTPKRQKDLQFGGLLKR
jgi:hypothetical protein